MRSRSAIAPQAERQLAAVVAADIAGYSRLMGADEEGTLARLKTLRAELIDPGIAAHRGRIVKTTGDGLLIEFSSPVEAVRWAVEMQQGMIERNADAADERRINFRVGINLGDVIVDDKDLYGDAVNIAARLETLAEPGGICISRTMHEQIRDRLALPFADGGEQSVRNIARPIGVYTLSADAVAALPKAETLPARRLVRPLYARRPVAVLALVALLSDDREQQYFADGVTEDLTTDLSRIGGSFVISRNTAFTYKDKPVNAKQIGRELGVRYVLEGSVQRTGKQVRVNAQLIDAGTDAHLWAERFERDTGDLFALQNEITSRIANSLGLAMIDAEAARPTERPDALDYILRGRAVGLAPVSRNTLAEAISLYEQALALDPHSVEAQERLALQLASRVLTGNADSAAADIARAEGLVAQSLSASPQSWLAHLAKGQVLRAQGRFAEAMPEYETVLALNRNAMLALFGLGQCKLYTGAIEETIPLQEQAIRLGPRDPGISVYYWQIGRVHLLQSRTDEAVVWLEKARNGNPAQSLFHAELASAYGLKGETQRAAAELAEAHRLSVDGRYASIARLSRGNYGVPKIRALFEATYFVGMRKAGMPEE